MKVVAFTGAQNTGKTTLMNELGLVLSRRGYNVQVGYRLPSEDQSISRRSKRLGFTINEETGFETQYHILLCYLAIDMETRKYAEINNVDYVIYDRSIWDVLPYSKRVMTDEQFNMISDMVGVHHDLYPTDALIMCEPVPFSDDGHRSTDQSFQDQICKLFNTLCADLSDLVLLNEPVDKRITAVCNHLKV